MYFIYWAKSGDATDGSDIFCNYIECDLKMEAMETCYNDFPKSQGWHRHGALDLSPVTWKVMTRKRALSLEE